MVTQGCDQLRGDTKGFKAGRQELRLRMLLLWVTLLLLLLL